MARERAGKGRPGTGRKDRKPGASPEPGPESPVTPDPPAPVAEPRASRAEDPVEDFKFLSSFVPEAAPGALRQPEASAPASLAEPAPPPPPETDGSAATYPEIAFPSEEDANPSEGPEEGAGSELLCFTIADEEYAIDIRRVWEIIRPRPVTEIPRVPAFISGIISLRGEIVPVLDLGLRLGFPPGEVVHPTAKVVVAIHDGRRIGMAVDAVSHKIRVLDAQITPPAALPGAQESGFLTGICRHEGRLIAILNAETVLGFRIGAADSGDALRRGAAGEAP